MARALWHLLILAVLVWGVKQDLAITMAIAMAYCILNIEDTNKKVNDLLFRSKYPGADPD